jgi:uncharacterized membrane protein
MKTNSKLEWLMILIVLIPMAYLAIVWKTLPDTIPMHFDIKGDANGFGTKTEFLLFVFVINPLLYLLMKVIPKIDPKGKVDATEKQYASLRIILSLLFSAMSCYIIYVTLHNTSSTNNFLFILLGVFFILLGNYIQTVKPNYFVGIRTPWALENQDNWRYTHRLGGKTMVICGIVASLAAVLVPAQIAGKIFFASVIIMVAIPFAFSYRYYLQNKKESV